jgi:hypothetical protein
MTDRAFLIQLEGYGLTTAEICYFMPDHPSLLQIYAWQEYDAAPVSIGVQSGPPIGAQKGPLCGYEDPLMLSACFALLAA